MLASLLAEISPATLIAVMLLAVITSAIHGAMGIGGGFLMVIVLAPIIGVKAVVPVLSVMLLISNFSRSLLNIRDFDKTVYLYIALPAIPCIIAGALIYGKLSGSIIALLLGTVVIASIPVRRWARSHELKATRAMLHGAGVVYGGLSGAVVGAGMLLIPFMLGYGLARQAFVATLAAIALTTNITRVAVFGGTQLLDERYLLLGILAGLATIPGNWLGRSLLRRMTNDRHTILVDILTLLGGLNFFWLAWHH